MPDWSYHTVLRPLLFRLAAETARDVTLGTIGRLAAAPGGRRFIEWLGHTRPPPGIGRTLGGLYVPGPVGLGPDLDRHVVAPAALAQFGFGFLELGPVTLDPVAASRPVERRDDRQTILLEDAPVNDGLAAIRRRFAGARGVAVPLGARLAYRPGADPAEAADERGQLIETLASQVQFFTLETRWDVVSGSWRLAAWRAHLEAVASRLRWVGSHPLLICVPPDADTERAMEIVATAVGGGAAGVVVGGGVHGSEGRLLGDAEYKATLTLVCALRERLGDALNVIAASGASTPAAALRLLDAGASLVQVDAGLVYGGPGLPKHINEAMAYRARDGHTAAVASLPVAPVGTRTDGAGEPVRAQIVAGRRPLTASWVWLFLLGLGMAIGGLLALLIAATRVVLPYDEAFLGLNRAAIGALNPRLLPFMAHDRVTLAGTMMSIGALYGGLAVGGVRRGAHWARDAIRLSGLAGFASFFLFLGYGYFDPLHGVVTLLLLPLFVLGLRGRLPPQEYPSPEMLSARRWHAALWGQLLFVTLGIGLVAGGLAIAGVGVTHVFVPEDLAFLRASTGGLAAGNPRLLPLVAHDRAGFGGTLVSDGLAMLGPALWGFRRGARWLWWMLFWAGIPGFGAALGVHAVIGYDDRWHLAPVLLALALYTLALALSHPYLCAPAAQPRQHTRRSTGLRAGGESMKDGKSPQGASAGILSLSSPEPHVPFKVTGEAGFSAPCGSHHTPTVRSI